MAVVGTAAMAINIALAILIARMTQQIVHGQVAQLLDGLRYQETLANAFGITSVINKNRDSATTGILSVVSLSIQDTIIMFGLAAATNVVLTALTAGRILWMRREASHILADKTLRPRYNVAIRLMCNIIPTCTLVYVGGIGDDTPEDRNFSVSSTRIPRLLVERRTFGPAEVMEIGPQCENKEGGERKHINEEAFGY
ncbi:hypothetical protein B0H13DRAFT_1884784 [Mycena leptocephala]|nr:hypothetical protein B0H13DRAFT_1884784 [Mycena leptocephala]